MFFIKEDTFLHVGKVTFTQGVIVKVFHSVGQGYIAKVVKIMELNKTNEYSWLGLKERVVLQGEG